MVEVKNINGTSNDRYSSPKGYHSWIDYWENKSGLSFLKYCSCVECQNSAKVGAHVMKTNSSRTWYIIPLCYECNKKTESFNVDEDYLVKVDD